MDGILTEEKGIRRNTCPRTTPSTTNPTYNGMGSKTDLRSEKPARHGRVEVIRERNTHNNMYFTSTMCDKLECRSLYLAQDRSHSP